MNIKEKKKILVLMDVDGTILSMDHSKSKDTFLEVFYDIFGRQIQREQLPYFSGNTDLGIIKHISEKVDIPFYTVLAAKNDLWTTMQSKYKPLFSPEFIKLHPNVRGLIEALDSDSDIVLGLLTGNNKQSAMNKVGTFGFEDKFEEGAYGCDHYDRNILPKIAWDRFASLYPDIEFGPQNTVIIGDSDKDILCARSSGSKVISVATGHYSLGDLQKESPDILLNKFESPQEMLDMIKSLFH